MKVKDIKSFIDRNGILPFKLRQVVYLPVFKRTSKSHNKSDKSYKFEWVPGIARIRSARIDFFESKYNFDFTFTTVSNCFFHIAALNDNSFCVFARNGDAFNFPLPKGSDLFSFAWAKSFSHLLNTKLVPHA